MRLDVVSPPSAQNRESLKRRDLPNKCFVNHGLLKESWTVWSQPRDAVIRVNN